MCVGCFKYFFFHLRESISYASICQYNKLFLVIFKIVETKEERKTQKKRKKQGEKKERERDRDRDRDRDRERL